MPRLSVAKQREILSSLPSQRKAVIKKYCRQCQMQGDGIQDILKKIGNFLGPIVKDVGPTILKEFIVPLLLKKAKEKAGMGLSLAGSGLKLAGSGKKTSPWIMHVKAVAKQKNIPYGEAMKIAKATYKK